MRVTTSFVGATDSRGARILVRWPGHRRLVPYRYECSGSDVHAFAVRHALAGAGVSVELLRLAGETRSGTGFVFVARCGQ
jgi:hypothetical protein